MAGRTPDTYGFGILGTIRPFAAGQGVACIQKTCEDNQNMSTHLSHQVSVAPSGRSFTVSPGQTILEAAIAAGVNLPYGCKDGACGSCKCQKISGEVEHAQHASGALTPEEAAAGMVLTCRAQPVSDVVLQARQVTDAHSHPVKKMPVRVRRLERLRPDVMRLELQLPATEKFAYDAGQYIEFLLRDGTRRAYSMANAPHTQGSAPGLELHIRHMPGGLFTDHVFSAMKEKDILRIEGPFGSCTLREDSTQPLIFLVSGTGFAPAKALLEQLAHCASARPVTLYWGGRRPQDIYMGDWLTQHHLPGGLRFIPVVSDALPEDGWQGRTGWVHQAVLDDFADLSGFQVYACGAPAMVNAARSSFTSTRQLADEDFFADAFTSAADQ